MFVFILSVHIVLCVFLIFVVLLQQGRGADAGATFGGSSNAQFAVAGSGNVLTKATTFCAFLFMLTSLLLVKYYPVGGVGIERNAGELLQGSVMEKGVVAEKKDASRQDSKEPQAGAASSKVEAAPAAAHTSSSGAGGAAAAPASAAAVPEKKEN